MNFYDLMPRDHQWVLGHRKLNPAECTPEYPLYGYDTWAFGMCRPVGDNPPPAIFDNIGNGPAVDFNLATDRAIVVSKPCADVLRSLLSEEVAEFISADVEGTKEEWEVINILDRVDCLDRQQSAIKYFPEDYSQPLKRGKPNSVERLIIDPTRAEGHDLFRLADWEVAVIASERIKQAMEDANITGVEFWPVC